MQAQKKTKTPKRDPFLAQPPAQTKSMGIRRGNPELNALRSQVEEMKSLLTHKRKKMRANAMED